MDIYQFGNRAFEFSAWQTPFENSPVSVLEVAFGRSRLWPEGREPTVKQPLLGAPQSAELVIRVHVHGEASTYRLSFDTVSAFRVLDEHGLMQLWHKTEELGGRPGQTTFRVRNHLWSEESPLSFLGAQDGWSFVIATDDDCIEIVARTQPEIELEEPPAQ
jgi:hypothetical protein